MRLLRYPFEKVPQLSKRDIDFTTRAEAMRSFYKYDVCTKFIQKVIEDKQKDTTDRARLVQYLKDQYKDLNISTSTQNNIDSLGNNTTFTITTAHQPSLLTGPLYFIYKIISTIKLCRDLNKIYPDFHFVPIFITGGEDHDFEEINHARIFNKTIKWEQDLGGSVGALATSSLDKVLESLKETLGDSHEAKDIYSIFENAFHQNKTYGAATVQLVNTLFGQYGLVVLNPSGKLLKESFIPFIKKEIFEQTSKGLVESTQAQLEAIGYKAQAHARAINLFYLGEGFRERIIQNDAGTFEVLNTDIRFSETEMHAEINAHPERFSPNVIMRPLYQELILPNLAYIGGGGELAYWMERMSQFEAFGLNFPMLIRRDSVLWIDAASVKKARKLEINLDNLFEEEHILIKNFLQRQSDTELNLQEEKNGFDTLYQQIAEKAKAIDPTLEKAVLAEATRFQKSISNLESRLVRTEKQKHEQALNQLNKLKEKLFPSNSLQERKDNFIPLYLKHGSRFFDILLEHLDPMDKNFKVILED